MEGSKGTMRRKMRRNFILAIAAVMVFVMDSAFATSGRVTQDGLPVFNTPSYTQVSWLVIFIAERLSKL